MNIECKRCETDQERAQVSLFLLKNRRDFHPSFTVQDIMDLIYSYMTEGHAIYIADDQGAVLGVCAYYIGTREQQFADRERAFLDMGLSHRSVRGTRAFVKGLIYLIDQLEEQHDGIQEVCFRTLTEKRDLTRMYAKFARLVGTMEGPLGEESCFAESLPELKANLDKFRRFS
ncbi:hypothetical protein [Paenibacillus sp. SYP-B4298]|uniref:hypothetical protein n=1 Tax=Paenibacillus sp. SYP-B4298 TaxID=2996034 RepID=UPI0022DD83C5|nr:hypothetical protein [Paenibacillus sp. SYP-B4298]